MRKLLCCGIFVILVTVLAGQVSAKDAPLPAAFSYVNDLKQVISQPDNAAINALARELEEKTTAQLAVVTVASTQPETIEQYAVRLFKQWGIGQKGKDNGILFIIAVDDHKVRIEVGYGLEGVVTDALSSAIIQQMVLPHLSRDGCRKGLRLVQKRSLV